MTKQPLNFVPNLCQECGKCCMLSPKDAWVGNDLSWGQKQTLKADREKLPALERTGRDKDGCDMLYYENKKAHCFVREKLGTGVLQPPCITYPNGKECVKQKEDNENG